MNNRVAHRSKQPINKRQTPAQGMRVKLPQQFKRVRFQAQVKPQEDACSIKALQSSDIPPKQDAFFFFGPMHCPYSTDSLSFDRDVALSSVQLDTDDWTTWMTGMIKTH